MVMGDAHQQQAAGGAAGASVAVGIDAMDRYRLLAGDDNHKDGDGVITAASVRALIHQVLGHPSIFAGFAELASTPAVRDALSGGTAAVGGGTAALNTLELFAFGTYSDYVKAGGDDGSTYLRLTDAQVRKLKQLSVVSLVQRTPANDLSGEGGGGRVAGRGGRSDTVPYSTIRRELGLGDGDGGSVREMEDLLIECIYSGVVSGKLDQRNAALVVVPSAGSMFGGGSISRDVRLPDDLPAMIGRLEDFQTRTSNLLVSLRQSSESVRGGRDREEEVWRDVERRISELVGGGKIGTSAAAAPVPPQGGGGVAAATASVAAAAAQGMVGMMDVDVGVAGAGGGGYVLGGGGGGAAVGGGGTATGDRKNKRSRGGFGYQQGSGGGASGERGFRNV